MLIFYGILIYICLTQNKVVGGLEKNGGGVPALERKSPQNIIALVC